MAVVFFTYVEKMYENTTVYNVIFCMIFAVLAIVAIMIVCGKSQKVCQYHDMWEEICACFVVIFCLGNILTCFFLLYYKWIARVGFVGIAIFMAIYLDCRIEDSRHGREKNDRVNHLSQHPPHSHPITIASWRCSPINTLWSIWGNC